MANPLAEEARTLPDSELDEALNEAYRELFNLQFQRGTRQLQNPMALRAARRQVARLHTIRRERARAVAAGAPLAPLSRPAPVPPPIQPEAADEQQDEEQPQDDLPTEAAQDAAPEPVAAASEQQDADEPAAEPPSAETGTADAAEAEAPADTADPQTESTKDA